MFCLNLVCSIIVKDLFIFKTQFSTMFPHFMTVALDCGEMTRDNCTYLSMPNSDTTTSPCQYTVCKCSDDICRIRFDFMVMRCFTNNESCGFASLNFFRRLTSKGQWSAQQCESKKVSSQLRLTMVSILKFGEKCNYNIIDNYGTNLCDMKMGQT